MTEEEDNKDPVTRIINILQKHTDSFVSLLQKINNLQKENFLQQEIIKVLVKEIKPVKKEISDKMWSSFSEKSVDNFVKEFDKKNKIHKAED